MGIIYILKNKTNNKHYVGQTNLTFKRRFGQHCHSNSLIGKAIRKYGKEGFEKILVENVPVEKLDEFEIEYIKKYSCIFPNGYNFDSGGHNNHKLHEETKRKISESQKGKKCGELNSFFGKHHSEKTKKKIGKANKNRKHPPFTNEHKKKISEALMGRKRKPFTKEHKRKMSISKMGNENSLGKIHTKEHKRKISESLKGRKFTEEHKRKISEALKNYFKNESM